MDDRRIARRFTVWFPMQLAADGEPALAVSHNISQTGALIASSAGNLKVGDTVTIAFEPPGGLRLEASGQVVRVMPNEADPHGLWPFHVAIAFEQPIEGLENTLEDIETKRGSRPPSRPPSNAEQT